jgi:SAM-dependent methyltransferase
VEDQLLDEYADAAEDHWWFVARRRILASVVGPLLAGGGPRLMLDAGTGSGGMAPLLDRYGTLVGVDASRHLLGLARPKIARLAAASLAALPFHAHVFDALFACDVLEHVADERAALAELHRVAKPDGRLVLTVPAYQFLWGEHDEINHHYRRYTRAQLAGVLGATGWRVQRLSYFNTLLFLPIAGIRLATGHRRRAEAPRSDLGWQVPRFVNAALEAVFASERHLMRHLDLPFGVSLLAVAAPR